MKIGLPNWQNFVTCLRTGHDVTLTHDRRYSMLLYWRRTFVFRQFDISIDYVAKINVTELNTKQKQCINSAYCSLFKIQIH